MSGQERISQVIIDALMRVGERYGLTGVQVREFLETQGIHSNSALREAMSVAASEAIAAGPNTWSGCRKVKVAGVLSAVSMDKVRHAYPEYEFAFEGSKMRDHSLAAACRQVDRIRLSASHPAGARVGNIGGDIEVSLLSSAVPIHNCCPSADVKDPFRKVQRFQRLRGRMVSGDTSAEVKERIGAFLTDPAVRMDWMCENMAQDCSVPVDYIMMCHVYDMTLEDVAGALASHGAGRVDGCLLYTPDMLERDKGELSQVDGIYEVDRAEDRIKFGFDGAPSWMYTHKYSEYIRFARDTLIVRGGVTYAYRVTEYRGSTLYFQMWPVLGDAPAVSTRVAYKLSGLNTVVVSGFSYEPGRAADADDLVAHEYRYPETTWVETVDYAQQQLVTGRFSLEDLSRKVRSITASTVINSVYIRKCPAIGQDQLDMFLANAAIIAAYEVEVAKQTAEAMTEAVLTARERTRRGFYAAVVDGVGKALAVIPMRIIGAIRARMQESVGSAECPISVRVDDGHRVMHVGKPEVAPSSLPATFQERNDIDDAIRVEGLTARAIAEHPDMIRALDRVVVEELGLDEVLESVESGGESPGAVPASQVSEPAPAYEDEGEVLESVDGEYGVEYVAGVRKVLTPLHREARAIGVPCEVHYEVSKQEVDVAGLEDYTIKAIEEFITHCDAETARIIVAGRDGWRELTSNAAPAAHAMRVIGADHHKPDFYQVESGRVSNVSYSGVVTTRYFPYAAVYIPVDGGSLLRVQNQRDEGDGPRVLLTEGCTYTGWVMVCEETVIYNGPVIRAKCVEALTRLRRNGDASLLRACVIVHQKGVPGCGKTAAIVAHAAPGSLIVANGRENIDSTRERRKAHDVQEAERARARGGIHIPFHDPDRRIRTIDSLLMGVRVPITTDLWVDEAFMEHWGKIATLVVLTGARLVQLYGDTEQLPFVNRYVDRGALDIYKTPVYAHWKLMNYLTRRLAMDTTAMVAPRYGYKIRTSSKVVRSMTLFNDVPFDNIPRTSNQFISFYQVDKAAMLKTRSNSHTVGEVQGETYRAVTLFKTQVKTQRLPDSWPYVLVAVTRHTHKCDIYSPVVVDDLLTKAVSALTDTNLILKYGEVSTVGLPMVA